MIPFARVELNFCSCIGPLDRMTLRLDNYSIESTLDPMSLFYRSDDTGIGRKNYTEFEIGASHI